jgi:hypothetical protein
MKIRPTWLGLVCSLFVLSNLPSQGAAATYQVDRLTDANPAGGAEGANYIGDLRYAITNAQSGDRITFVVTGTINLAGGAAWYHQERQYSGTRREPSHRARRRPHRIWREPRRNGRPLGPDDHRRCW